MGIAVHLAVACSVNDGVFSHEMSWLRSRI